ncbi:MAG: GNAT family N-acetyltransferase [Chloroflexi bacterium]|nr:GNAT family N-acetyltransferase [Chloroflexota bacterium]
MTGDLLLDMIQLAPFRRTDQAAVKQLILDGLVEHWGFLDPTKNPDLDDIATTYANATFLVAQSSNEIVGCGALVPHTARDAKIVRMSVKKNFRTRGIGTLILHGLCNAARAQGFQRVITSTTDTWHDAIAFYLRNGFHITHQVQDGIYFERWLNDEPSAVKRKTI